jgi:hypothetical protein
MLRTAEFCIPKPAKVLTKFIDACNAPINPVPEGPNIRATTFDLNKLKIKFITDDPPIILVDLSIDFDELT